MKKAFDSRRLDPKAFAHAATPVTGAQDLTEFPRLAAEAREPAPGCVVNWTVEGELRPGSDSQDQVWLHLLADTCLELTCQRCMGPMQQALAVDRWFRFARDEASAAELDDEVEEDVLTLDVPLDLVDLVEDELLMALPLVPRHETCPVEVKLTAVDPDFDAAADAKPNPFSALASLRLDKSH